MSNDFVVTIRKLAVEFAGFLMGEKIATQIKDSGPSRAVGETAGWIAGIHLNKKINYIEAGKHKDSVDYGDYIQDKMKYRDDHLAQYEEQLTGNKSIQR